MLFGKEASIFVGVDKAQGIVAVNGTLDPIDIGPLRIGGVNGGQDKAAVDVELGPFSQKVYINGDVRSPAGEIAIFVDAELLPTAQARLAFTSKVSVPR